MTTESAPLFYEHGLHFSCQRGCGACCKVSGKVKISEAEAPRLARALQLNEAEFKDEYTLFVGGERQLGARSDGACILLDEQDACRVYPARPLQCRTYPFWDEILANEWTWMLERRTCPGLERGRMYSLADIELARKGLLQVDGYTL